MSHFSRVPVHEGQGLSLGVQKFSSYLHKTFFCLSSPDTERTWASGLRKHSKIMTEWEQLGKVSALIDPDEETRGQSWVLVLWGADQEVSIDLGGGRVLPGQMGPTTFPIAASENWSSCDSALVWLPMTHTTPRPQSRDPGSACGILVLPGWVWWTEIPL